MPDNDLGFDAFINLKLANMEEFAAQIGQSIQDAIQRNVSQFVSMPNTQISNAQLTLQNITRGGTISTEIPQIETQSSLIKSIQDTTFSFDELTKAAKQLVSGGFIEPSVDRIKQAAYVNRMALEKVSPFEPTVGFQQPTFPIDDLKKWAEKPTGMLSQDYIQELAAKYQGLAQGGENVVKSFWSVWSISWAIRGVIGDIFGYSSKWIAETNKLTRAFQSGLYLYAGTQRILSGITQQMITQNAHSLTAVGLKYAISEMNIKTGQQEQEINVLKIQGVAVDNADIVALNTQIVARNNTVKQLTTQIAQEKLLAVEETAATRNKILSLGKSVSIWAAVAVAIIGVIRWVQDLNDQYNKAKAAVHDIYLSFQAISGLKVSMNFTDLSGLIDKLATQFPDVGKKLQAIQDPIQQFNAALAETAKIEATSQRSIWNWLKASADAMHAMRGEMSQENLITPVEKQEAAVKKLSDTLNNLFSPASSDAAIKTAILNIALKGTANSAEGAVGSLQDYLKYVALFKDAFVMSAAIEQYNALIAKGARESSDLFKELYYKNKQFYDNLFKAGESTFEDTTKTAMTMVEFYTKMYDAYSGASEKNSKYTQESLKWKNLLISALNTEIRSLGQQLTMLSKTDEKYKELSIQRANDIRQLEELINLQEKLNSTWFNIPTAIIKPTQSQLTGATVYLNPNINIKASGIDEIVRIAKDEIGKVIYDNLKLQKGNVGSPV
jgi:hypothetical protein